MQKGYVPGEGVGGVIPPLLCRGMAHTGVTKSQFSANGFSWVGALPAKEFSSVPNPYLHLS